MRRRLASLATATALVLAVASVGLASGGTIAEDSFSNANYTGGSGWSSSWTETGESSNPSAGVIRAVDAGCDGSSCVRFDAGIISLGTYRLSRLVDTSGAASVTLRFTYKRSGIGTLQVGTQSGSTTLTGGTGGYANGAFNVPAADIGISTDVRFSLSNLALGASAYIDNIEVEVTYPTTTTSTTSTTSTTTTLLPTTTTSLPITTTSIQNPPTTTTTVDLPGTTTTTTSSTSSSTSTTTTVAAGSSTTTPGSGDNSGNDDSNNQTPGSVDADEGDSFDQPLTEAEIAIAESSNIATNLAAEGDFEAFGGPPNVDPRTGLSVSLQSGVEAISTDFFSAIALGALVVILARRRITDEDEIDGIGDGENPVP